MQSFRIFTETALCEKCGKVHEGACSESKDNSTMTGKTAAKVEVNPSENKAK